MRYLRPDSLEDALSALDGADLRIVAGCTDIFPATQMREVPGPVLDITGIGGLRGIARDGGDWVIGAATTWSDIIRADLPPAFHGLQLAAREVGARQIQNRGTLGGNLCNASPAADGVPPLLTLDADIEIASLNGVRRLRLDAFLTGPRQTALRPGELLTAIRIPRASAAGTGHFLKLGARRHLVISIAMCAARVEIAEGRVRQLALAIGACGPVATRLRALEDGLIGAPLDPARIDDGTVASALSPIDDVRADAAYRARAAGELLRRTVACLAPAAAA